MNILFLTQEYPPDTGGGGVGTYTYHMAHTLAEQGHSIHVLSSVAPGQPPSVSVQGNVYVHRALRWKFEAPLLRRAFHLYFSRSKHQLEYAYGIRRVIAQIVQRFNIQIIEAPEIWSEGVFYLPRRRVPMVIKSHGSLFLLRQLNGYKETLDWRLVDRVERYWYTRVDRRTSPSLALAKLLAEHYGLSASDIDVVPYSIDLDCLQPRPLPIQETLRVLFVGRLEPLKGIYTLVDAMPQVVARVQNVEFVFVGADTRPNDKSCLAEMQRRLQANGMTPRAILRGTLPYEKIRDEIWASHVCVLPSTWETYPNFVLEALACGRPVVASRVGGIPEMIRDGESGVLVEPGNSAELASALIRVLSNSDYSKCLAANARQRVERENSRERVARRQIEIYESTIENARSRFKRKSP